MGRDIHLYAEKLTNNKWQSLDSWANEDEDGNRYFHATTEFYQGGRDYKLFNLLIDGNHYKEFEFGIFNGKGKPLDCSGEIKQIINYEDWHSHNYVSLAELKSIDLDKLLINVEGYISLLDYLEYRNDITDFRNCYISNIRNNDRSIVYINECDIQDFLNSINFPGIDNAKKLIKKFINFTKIHKSNLGLFEGIVDLDNCVEYQFFKYINFDVKVYINYKFSLKEYFKAFFVDMILELEKHSNGHDNNIRIVYWFDN